MNDIETNEDVVLLLNGFYQRVKTDPILYPIFNLIIRDRYEEHMRQMYRFWQTVLLEAKTHHGVPFFASASLLIEPKHFAQWLKLWHANIDDLFKGEKADEAKWRGDRIAVVYLLKLGKFKNYAARPLL